MNKELFSDFASVSAKAWKQKIQVDLKGADYNDTLIWQSLEGVDVKPFYHRDNFSVNFNSIPGQPQEWLIGQFLFIDDETITNKLAIDVLTRGADALFFTSEKEFDIHKTFEGIDTKEVATYFDLKFLSVEFMKKLYEFFGKESKTVYYNIDPIGNLASTGNWFNNLKKDYSILDTIVSEAPKGNILSVDSSLYQNAGANMVQQLAYALAHVNEYLNHFHESLNKNLSITFTVAIGPNYFFEIAKIRALRKLYVTLAREYGISENCHIISTPSKRNKTIYDYNVNMLRTTTECMSAVLGGADTICNLPYDALYHKSNEFGERISRNQLLILKSESYFDMVSNAADGSYYIESLTNELAEKALVLFKSIESSGGFLGQLKEGTIQRKIKESAQKEQQLFDNGSLVLLGTNKHPSDLDRMKDDLELYPFVKRNARKTLIAPIITKRLAEKNEQERLEKEKTNA